MLNDYISLFYLNVYQGVLNVAETIIGRDAKGRTIKPPVRHHLLNFHSIMFVFYRMEHVMEFFILSTSSHNVHNAFALTPVQGAYYA